jgi:hypothetical protein
MLPRRRAGPERRGRTVQPARRPTHYEGAACVPPALHLHLANPPGRRPHSPNWAISDPDSTMDSSDPDSTMDSMAEHTGPLDGETYTVQACVRATHCPPPPGCSLCSRNRCTAATPRLATHRARGLPGPPAPPSAPAAAPPPHPERRPTRFPGLRGPQARLLLNHGRIREDRSPTRTRTRRLTFAAYSPLTPAMPRCSVVAVRTDPAGHVDVVAACAACVGWGRRGLAAIVDATESNVDHGVRSGGPSVETDPQPGVDAGQPKAHVAEAGVSRQCVS